MFPLLGNAGFARTTKTGVRMIDLELLYCYTVSIWLMKGVDIKCFKRNLKVREVATCNAINNYFFISLSGLVKHVFETIYKPVYQR